MSVKIISKYFFVFVVFISSCSTNKNSNDNNDFISDENLYLKTVKQYTFKLKPYSSNRLVNINYKEDINKFSKVQQDSIIKEYNSYLCFVFEIDIDDFKGDISDYEEPGKDFNYDQKVNYYLFEMQNSFKLKDSKGGETPCLIYYFERLNEIAKTNRFIVGFKKPKTEEQRFEYENPYFNCGKINFSINKQHLALN
jgi:hypothetical protein